MSKRTAHKLGSKWRSDDVRAEENIDFSALLLSDRVLKGLKKSGFKKPSPVQLKAIPLGRCGLDLVIQAKSGTGKTCVFSVVALEALTETSALQVLILAPTREIAVQICNVINAIGCEIPSLQCHMFIGGTPLKNDIKKLGNCNIAVGSVGRLRQLIETGAMITGCIRLLILDEADSMVTGNFLKDFHYIFNHLPETKQVLALSATYPEELLDCIKMCMRNPTYVRISENELALKGILQFYHLIQHHPINNVVHQSKFEALLRVLDQISFSQCLIYCKTITRVDTLCEHLNKNGHVSARISSGDNQEARLNSLNMLKEFQCRIMVSSDLTARGIDAENVDMVINFDMAPNVETYLHRIGRAGRYGSKAIAISFVCTGYEEQKLGEFEQVGGFEVHPLPDPLPSDLLTWTEEMVRSAKPAAVKRSLEDFSNNPSAETAENIDNGVSIGTGVNKQSEGLNGSTVANNNACQSLQNSSDTSSSSSESGETETSDDGSDKDHESVTSFDDSPAVVSRGPRLSSECEDARALPGPLDGDEFSDIGETASNCDGITQITTEEYCSVDKSSDIADSGSENLENQAESTCDKASEFYEDNMHLLYPLHEGDEHNSSFVSVQHESECDDVTIIAANISDLESPTLVSSDDHQQQSKANGEDANTACEDGVHSSIVSIFQEPVLAGVQDMKGLCGDMEAPVQENCEDFKHSNSPVPQNVSDIDVNEIVDSLFQDVFSDSGCPSYERILKNFSTFSGDGHSAGESIGPDIENTGFSTDVLESVMKFLQHSKQDFLTRVSQEMDFDKEKNSCSVESETADAIDPSPVSGCSQPDSAATDLLQSTHDAFTQEKEHGRNVIKKENGLANEIHVDGGTDREKVEENRPEEQSEDILRERDVCKAASKVDETPEDVSKMLGRASEVSEEAKAKHSGKLVEEAGGIRQQGAGKKEVNENKIARVPDKGSEASRKAQDVSRTEKPPSTAFSSNDAGSRGVSKPTAKQRGHLNRKKEATPKFVGVEEIFPVSAGKSIKSKNFLKGSEKENLSRDEVSGRGIGGQSDFGASRRKKSARTDANSGGRTKVHGKLSKSQHRVSVRNEEEQPVQDLDSIIERNSTRAGETFTIDNFCNSKKTSRNGSIDQRNNRKQGTGYITSNKGEPANGNHRQHYSDSSEKLPCCRIMPQAKGVWDAPWKFPISSSGRSRHRRYSGDSCALCCATNGVPCQGGSACYVCCQRHNMSVPVQHSCQRYNLAFFPWKQDLCSCCICAQKQSEYELYFHLERPCCVQDRCCPRVCQSPLQYSNQYGCTFEPQPVCERCCGPADYQVLDAKGCKCPLKCSFGKRSFYSNDRGVALHDQLMKKLTERCCH